MPWSNEDMEELRKTVQELTRTLNNVQAEVKSVRIASQTVSLALYNDAVESARAGARALMVALEVLCSNLKDRDVAVETAKLVIARSLATEAMQRAKKYVQEDPKDV